MKRKNTKGITLNEFGATVSQLGATVSDLGGKFDGLAMTVNQLGATVSGLVLTVKELGEMLGFVVEHMATKEDLAEFRREVKGDMFTLQTQVNGIESDIRDMKHARLEVRVGDLEEKVFGKAR